MAIIGETKYPDCIFRKYKIESVTNDEQALEWIGRVILMKEFEIINIRMEDFRSYHDGTESKDIDMIESVESFVREFLHSGYIAVMVDASIDDKSISITVNMDKYFIMLMVDAEDKEYLEKLEQLLKLV